MAVGQPKSAQRRAGGVIVLLLGVGLIAWGVHYLAINGTCSSTGYVAVGPVPTCHGPEGLYITGTFFAGPLIMLIGWAMASIAGLAWPVTCVFLAASFGSIKLDRNVSPGGQSFGLILGVVFLALALLSVLTTVRKRRARPRAVPGGSRPGSAAFTGPAGSAVPAGPAPEFASTGGYPVAPGPSAEFTGGTPVTPVTPPSALTPPGPEDPLDRIAKLARLRDTGALTNEEFEREKAKLLAQM
jgi:hypothetical protein